VDIVPLQRCVLKSHGVSVIFRAETLLDQFVGRANAADNEGKGFLGRFRKTNTKEGFLAASIK
jgi:hypothetical protein